MNQLFTHVALVGGLSMLFIFCQSEQNCHELTGRWSNREGQVFQFEPEGRALWLIKFGSRFDTFPIRYQYDCGKKNTTLDLSEFKSGPLAGKTLYGIVEWSGDSVFRFDAEAGSLPEVRPEKFNIERAERYFREVN